MSSNFSLKFPVSDQPERFFALVELMGELAGHQKIVGEVHETKLAGAGFLQVDAIDREGKLYFSTLISPSAIYAVNPISRELAIELAKKYSRELEL